MRALYLAPIGVLVAVLLTTACVKTSSVCAEETQDIVVSIPWPDNEQAEYVLLDRDGKKECGQGSLGVANVAEGYQFNVNFSNDEGSEDKSTVVVDGTTLKPITVRRERNLPDEQSVIEGVYDTTEKILNITETQDGKERTIPARLEHDHYYDNESSLFLWRTIPFAEGYKASYYAVLANQGGKNYLVTIEVKAKETITVPAGTFETWRLETRSEGVKQVAWYTTSPDHILVQYDNSRQLFELVRAPAEPTATPGTPAATP